MIHRDKNINRYRNGKGKLIIESLCCGFKPRTVLDDELYCSNCNEVMYK